ncbi:MAG: class I adenylate-forming enzyme family protein, partial [Candidatus Binatia bacterium]
AISATGVRIVLAVRRFGKNDYDQILGDVASGVRVVFLDTVGELGKGTVHADSPAPTDPAAIFFTSGSTAKPKAVVLSHAALTHNAYELGEHLGIEPEDRTWTALPLFFSGGFCLCALSTLSHGGTVVLNEVFEPGAALARLESERCTVMIGWTHGAQMLEHPSFERSRLSLRKGVGGNLELADRFLQPDHRAIGCYGMTETSTMCVAGRATDSREVRRTFGRPMPGVTIRIADPESGAERAAGEEGEILVRSPAQMLGYDGMRAEDCFDAEGFFHTGDLGFVDHDGCLHFTRRLKDVIKTMGVNVAAAEVEATLERHPAVARAYVIGVPHPVRGENVAAFVIPSGATLD